MKKFPEFYFQLRFAGQLYITCSDSNNSHSVDRLFCSLWEASSEAVLRLASRALHLNAPA